MAWVSVLALSPCRDPRASGVAVWLALVSLLVAGCQALPSGRSPVPATAPPAAVVEISDPIIDADFPDPDMLWTGEFYYLFATNAGESNVQVARSADLARWDRLPDALPRLPSWASPGHTWAPAVTTTADGSGYVMYFTARHAASGRQCIGAATSKAPEGPFEPAEEAPFICQLDEGGSIDASAFADDDGQRYVLWKNDGNCCVMDTWLYLQAVSADGLRLEGAPRRLLTADQSWENFLVEAPTLWKHAGRYYLFYSANRYAGAEYAVGYAVADAIAGPYQKPAGPILVTSMTGEPVIGPGGQDVVRDTRGATWLLYHAWDQSLTYRRLHLNELSWEGERPVVKGGTTRPPSMP